MGSWNSAMAPTRKIITDKTAAKIGRSIKKRANFMAAPWKFCRGSAPAGALLVTFSFHGSRGGQHRVTIEAGIHGDQLRLHDRARMHTLHAVHDHGFAGLQAFLHDAQTVVEPADLHAAIRDLVVLVDHVDELLALVGADGAIV